MITEFNVYSRQAIEDAAAHEVPHIIISIRTPGDRHAILRTNEHTLNVLRLSFHDLNDAAMEHVEVRDQYEAECFNAEHARRILAIVKTNPDAQRLIVNCDAGISRSPAVAAALSKILARDDSYFFSRYCPNSRVHRTVLEEHYAGLSSE